MFLRPREWTFKHEQIIQTEQPMKGLFELSLENEE